MGGNSSPRVSGLDAFPVRDGDADTVGAANTFEVDESRLKASEAFHLLGHSGVLRLMAWESLAGEDHRNTGSIHRSAQ